MKHIHYIIFAALALLSSCEKPIDFDNDEVSPYVVVISKPVSDSLMSVYVGYSRFFLDNRDYNPVDNAVVILSDGANSYPGVYDPQCFRSNTYYYDHYDGGYWTGDSTYFGGYTFTLRPQPGDTVHLTATVPGYDKVVSATTTMPQSPELEILDCIADTGNGNYYDEYGGYYAHSDCYFKVRFKVKSHGGNEYYSVRILNAIYGRIHPTQNIWGWDTTAWESNYFTVSDPLVNSRSFEDIIDGYDGSFYGNEMIFSSELFQNGEHEFTAIFSKWPQAYEDFSTMPIRIEVKSLSRELYRYEQTAANADYDFFDGLFSEPTQVICNIKGGVGVFGGSTGKQFRVQQLRYGTFQHNDGYYFKKGKK